MDRRTHLAIFICCLALATFWTLVAVLLRRPDWITTVWAVYGATAAFALTAGICTWAVRRADVTDGNARPFGCAVIRRVG